LDLPIGGLGIMGFLKPLYCLPIRCGSISHTRSKEEPFFLALFIDFIWGVFATHLLRTVLKKINWLRFAPGKMFLMFVLGVVSAGLISYYGSKYTSEVSGHSFDQYERNERRTKAIAMEKEMKLAGKEYYNYEKNAILDSAGYAATLQIKKTTGWFKDKTGEWKFEEQEKEGIGGV
jgi:hypothetical protein